MKKPMYCLNWDDRDETCTFWVGENQVAIVYTDTPDDKIGWETLDDRRGSCDTTAQAKKKCERLILAWLERLHK